MTLGLTEKEIKFLKKLNTPSKIQDYLNSLPVNFETRGETLMSPRKVIREKKAHCLEGALLAALALKINGQKPLLLDLKTSDRKRDNDHVVALFRKNGHWGAISKTNHAVLRYREPVYKNIRELAMSYFHEYFTDNGKKTLESYSLPFDLSKSKVRDWAISEKNLWPISKELNRVKHFKILDKRTKKGLRLADRIEIKAGKILEWKRLNSQVKRVI